jgi:L-alanine-DL-glutamate epimerase-like enolase superfamily enzyme
LQGSITNHLSPIPPVKIESIEAFAIDIPLTKNFGGSTYSVLKRSTVVTLLKAGDGLVSEIYNGDNREHAPAIARLIEQELAPRVKGLELLEIERAWQAMFELSHTNRDRKTLMEAIACVDCALWDLVGKSLGKNVATLLGTNRERLPIISIGGYYMEGKKLADYGGLQVQGRRPRARGGLQACRGRPQGGRSRLRARRGREPRLEPAGCHPLRAVDRAARHRLVRGAVPLVRRRGHDGAGASGDPHPGDRRPVRDHEPRYPQDGGSGRGGFRQL